MKERALEYHKKGGPGKIEVTASKPVKTKKDLELAYTPGVAFPCLEIEKDPEKALEYTFKGNTIAIVTDGTRILGLGDIGPLAGLPVMEGKAMLFKVLGDVNAIPLCISVKGVEEFVETMKRLEPTFGGVNLEDIKHPECFEVEKRLSEELNIPVFHDDQHGTAVVVLAALLNALKVVGKRIESVKIVVSGSGSAGVGVAKLLVHAGARDVVVFDSRGALYAGRDGLSFEKEEMARQTNKARFSGTITEALRGADVCIGASKPKSLTAEMVTGMAKNSVLFALANPEPEIAPGEARKAGVKVLGFGLSNYPNQVNNVLGFPGIFRGMLDVRAMKVNNEMKIAAAHAIAGLVSARELRENYIIPDPTDKRVAPRVAAAVARAAVESGVAKVHLKDFKAYEKEVAKRIAKTNKAAGGKLT